MSNRDDVFQRRKKSRFGTAVGRWATNGYAELPSREALGHAWRPITAQQKDGRWIWAVADGVHAPSGLPFEPVLVRWENGRWFEPGDRVGCLEHFWKLTHYVMLPTSLPAASGER